MDAASSVKAPSVSILPASEKVGDDDACLHWLRERYGNLSSGTGASDGQVRRRDVPLAQTEAVAARRLIALQNDVKACDELRWSRFSFPSHPHHPLRTNYNNETSNPSPVKAVVDKASPAAWGEEGSIVSIEDVKKRVRAATSGKELPTTMAEEEAGSEFFQRSLLLGRHTEALQNASTVPLLRTPPVQPQPPTDDGRPDSVPLPRPYLGGYVTSPPRSDTARFVVFPQLHHSRETGDGAEVPQEVPGYVRGSVSLLVNDEISVGEVDATDAAVPVAAITGKEFQQSLTSQMLDAARLNISVSRKFPYSPSQPNSSDSLAPVQPQSFLSWMWPQLVSAPPAPVSAVDVELYTNNNRTERRYAPEKHKVEKRKLIESGVKTVVHRPDPRRSTALSASFATVENSHRRRDKVGEAQTLLNGTTPSPFTPASGDDAIVSVLLEDSYRSAVQKLGAKSRESGTYSVQWRAGPGFEHSTSDGLSTIFARFSAESWAEWPIAIFGRSFKLKLRNESCLMQPLNPGISAVPTHISGSDALSTERSNGTSHAVRSSAWWRNLGPHEYLWATQGPKWNPKLLRGFDNDYSNMHHSKSWYSTFSVELSKKKDRRKGDSDDADGADAPPATGLFANANLMAFANACFVDSLWEPPRASVGFSLTSELPRLTVDAFNKFVPHKFECSFSWFVAVQERELRSGLQAPDVPESLQFMRVSPVETFRHMKCGLTWKF